MANTDINVLTPADVDFVNQELIKATAEEYEIEFKPTWDQLWQSAQNFLLAYEKLDIMEKMENKKIVNAIMQDTFDNESVPAGLRFSASKGKLFYTRAKYVLAFSFDEQVTAFRGQAKKSAVYAHWDSKNQKISSFELPLTKLAQLINEEGRLKDITPGKLQAEGAVQLEKDKENFPNQKHLQETQAAYMGTKSRLMQFYRKAQTDWWKMKNGLLMWQEQRTWTVARVTSFGDMKEAYVAALMTKHRRDVNRLCSHTLGKPAFYDHDLIRIFFTDFIANVTNKAAIVEEDVVTKEGQYAVKSTGAGMPSMGQYLWAAEYILKNKQGLSKKELEAAIETEYPMDAERNKILGEGNNEIGKIIDQLLQENKLNENQAMALQQIYKV